MKRSLFLIVAILLSVGTYNAFGQACSPDAQYTSPGIYPDSATGLPDAYANSGYSTVMTVVVPTDTVVYGIAIPIDSLVLVSFTGFPTSGNFSHACNPGNCSFPGGSHGCVLITGSPTMADTGLWHLHAVVNAYVGGSTSPQVQHIDYYTLRVNAPSGIATLDQTKFEVAQNTPNPFGDKTEIDFSVTQPGAVNMNIYNMLGKLVCQAKIDAHKGFNKYMLNAETLPSGIYMYSMNNGQRTVYKKMIITR